MSISAAWCNTKRSRQESEGTDSSLNLPQPKPKSHNIAEPQFPYISVEMIIIPPNSKGCCKDKIK